MEKTAQSVRSIETIRLQGPVPYQQAYEAQIARRARVESGQATNALFLLEHTPVFTLGRKADESHLLESRQSLHRMGIEVCNTDRGGDVTYHGPGQLVAYPVLNLNHWKPSIGWYLRTLEDTLIQLLAGYGLQGERMEGYTGVWVGGAKVAAIGVAIHQWTTYHGIGLNVDPNMDHWGLIVPCGIPKPVTSLAQLLGNPPPMDEVMNNFEKHFRAAFCTDPSL